MRRVIGLGAAALLVGSLSACASEPEPPSYADLHGACLDVIAGQFEDAATADDYCSEALDNAMADPTSDSSLELIGLLTEHVESAR